MHKGRAQRRKRGTNRPDRLRGELPYGPLNRPAIISRAVHVEDAAAGEVWLVWAPGETDIAGVYRAEFEVVYQDGRRETFPGDGYISIQILDDLG